jgi:hypothetical protein
MHGLRNMTQPRANFWDNAYNSLSLSLTAARRKKSRKVKRHTSEQVDRQICHLRLRVGWMWRRAPRETDGWHVACAAWTGEPGNYWRRGQDGQTQAPWWERRSQNSIGPTGSWASNKTWPKICTQTSPVQPTYARCQPGTDHPHSARSSPRRCPLPPPLSLSCGTVQRCKTRQKPPTGQATASTKPPNSGRAATHRIHTSPSVS